MRDQDLIKLIEVREKEMEQNLLQKAEAFGYLYKEHQKKIRVTCGPYPIHRVARLASKMKRKKNEKKMWVDFRVLENPSPRRNDFSLESPLTFIFIFKWGKSSKNKPPPPPPPPPPNDSNIGKKWSPKTRF